jgi:hypothetical protein
MTEVKADVISAEPSESSKPERMPLRDSSEGAEGTC